MFSVPRHLRQILISVIAIKPERLLELLAERQVVGGRGLTLSVRHTGSQSSGPSREFEAIDTVFSYASLLVQLCDRYEHPAGPKTAFNHRTTFP
jgi:hypothetical protein